MPEQNPAASPLKPVAYAGSFGTVPASGFLGTEEAFAKTGRNTGNLAFHAALAGCIAEPCIAVGFRFDPATIRETYRAICIPAANFLYSRFDFSDLAGRLEKAGLPVVIAGLGAQAGRSVEEVKLKPGTERLLRVLAEHCRTIAVRGDFTAQVLEHYGVTNYEVLGCPSNFLNPDPGLGQGIAQRLAGPMERWAFVPTFYDRLANFEMRLFRRISPMVEEIICQEPLAAVALARGDRDEALEAWFDGPGFQKYVPKPDRTAFRHRLRSYFGVEPWIEAYRRLDVVVGTRIHGVNLGWQSGRPALIFPHDLRTRELAEIMGLPVMATTDAGRETIAKDIVDTIGPYAERFDAVRASLATRFGAMLERAGLTPSERLKRIAAGPV